MTAYTIDPLNERCVACDRRIGIVDYFLPALYVPGVVHARCVDDQVEPEDED